MVHGDGRTCWYPYHYFAGHALAEIATLCDLPVSTVKKRMRVARELLGEGIHEMVDRIEGLLGADGAIRRPTPRLGAHARPASTSDQTRGVFRPAGDLAVEATALEIAPARDTAGLADFERTLIEAYPLTEMQPWREGSFFAPGVLDSAWRLFVGYEDGAAVCTAGAYVTATMTMVELVSSRSETRGKGYGAAITAAATVAAPDRPAMLIASDAGHGIYGRLGYLPLLRETIWLGSR